VQIQYRPQKAGTFHAIYADQKEAKMMNEDIIQSKWNEFRGGIRNLWGRLTEEELDATKGNLIKLSGLIQERYGETKEQVKSKLDQLLASFNNASDHSESDTNVSSYQRNPTAEDERNFKVGKNYDSDEWFEGNPKPRH